MNLGLVSQRMLDEMQAGVIAGSPSVVVLVEGLSDAFAIEAIAPRLGCDLAARRVAVLPMGGVTNIGRFLALFGPAGRGVGLAGLCDAGEEEWVRSRLAAAGVDGQGFFVCHRDLEDELLRSLGSTGVEAVIEREGELDSLRKLQQTPYHRGRPVEGQLHRFVGARSGRKHRYARLMAESVDLDRVPAPLRDVVAYVT